MKVKYVLFPIVTVVLFSCQSVPKDIAYFQDLEQYMQQDHSADYSKYEPTIKNNDQLLITVSSPVLDQTQVAQFNLPMNTYLTPGTTAIAHSIEIQTYTVNKDGYIDFPVVGEIQLGGLTKSQAVGLLSDKISKYLEEPIINVQITSFKVTVLGEVIKPGPIEVTNERISILDAIGAAGDLTIYGNRQNVTLIRDHNGEKEFAKIDLTKSDIFSSPYFYLQQNDVLVIEPNDTKKKTSHFGTAENYQISMFSLTFTAISVVISFLGIILR